MPSAQRLDESAPRVFARYFPAYPISFDNEPAKTDKYAEGLLAADGEGGNRAAYGGLLRQRPLPRPVDPSDDWALDDMKTEVQRATDAGIGFQIVLMPDANTRVVADPAAPADAVESVADHPSLYRLDDDRLVISPFMPERVGADWWAAWITTMDDRGIAVAFAAGAQSLARDVERLPVAAGTAPALDTALQEMRASHLIPEPLGLGTTQFCEALLRPLYELDETTDDRRMHSAVCREHDDDKEDRT